MTEPIPAEEQERKVFEYCVENLEKFDTMLGFWRLDKDWLLIQYDPKLMKNKIDNFGSDTPVWAIKRPHGKERKDCFVVYGDPHVVYDDDGQSMKLKLEDVNFNKVAKFTLGNGDILYFVGEEAANGNLTEVYIQSENKGSVFVWGKHSIPEEVPELIGTIDDSGLDWK